MMSLIYTGIYVWYPTVPKKGQNPCLQRPVLKKRFMAWNQSGCASSNWQLMYGSIPRNWWKAAKPNTVVPEAERRCSDGCVAAAQHETLMGGAAAASDVQRHTFGILRALRANFDCDLPVTPIKKRCWFGVDEQDHTHNSQVCWGILEFCSRHNS